MVNKYEGKGILENRAERCSSR